MASVVRVPRSPTAGLGDAVAEFLGDRDLAPTTRRVYGVPWPPWGPPARAVRTESTEMDPLADRRTGAQCTDLSPPPLVG